MKWLSRLIRPVRDLQRPLSIGGIELAMRMERVHEIAPTLLERAHLTVAHPKSGNESDKVAMVSGSRLGLGGEELGLPDTTLREVERRLRPILGRPWRFPNGIFWEFNYSGARSQLTVVCTEDETTYSLLSREECQNSESRFYELRLGPRPPVRRSEQHGYSINGLQPGVRKEEVDESSLPDGVTIDWRKDGIAHMIHGTQVLRDGELVLQCGDSVTQAAAILGGGGSAGTLHMSKPVFGSRGTSCLRHLSIPAITASRGLRLQPSGTSPWGTSCHGGGGSGCCTPSGTRAGVTRCIRTLTASSICRCHFVHAGITSI